MNENFDSNKTKGILKNARNTGLIGGTALIGAKLLMGPELKGAHIVGISLIAGGLICDSLLRREERL